MRCTTETQEGDIVLLGKTLSVEKRGETLLHVSLVNLKLAFPPRRIAV